MDWACVFLCVATLLSAAPGQEPPRPRLVHPDLAESSGLVRSRVHPGIFWTHGDSGNPPLVFAVKADGEVVGAYRVSVPNVDWEDIATDDSGHLYLADIGNNGGLLPVRAIHRIAEPDPSKPSGGPIRPDRSWYYRFDGSRFDAEGLVVDSDHLLLVTKRRDGEPAELRSIPLDRAAGLLRPTTTDSVGILADFREPATAADLSTDGRRLVVAALDRVRIYEREERGWRTIREIRYPASQYEAVAWDGPTRLLLVDEAGHLLSLSLQDHRDPHRSLRRSP